MRHKHELKFEIHQNTKLQNTKKESNSVYVIRCHAILVMTPLLGT